MRPENMKYIKKYAEKSLALCISNILSDVSHQARETKEKIKQMGLHQTKKVLHSKGNHQNERQPTELKKVLANDVSNKG